MILSQQELAELIDAIHHHEFQVADYWTACWPLTAEDLEVPRALTVRWPGDVDQRNTAAHSFATAYPEDTANA